MEITKEQFVKIVNIAEEENDNTKSDYITPELICKFLPTNFSVNDDVLISICSSLKCGKHLILSGPPGTGKTTIAKAIICAATQLNLSSNSNSITTATSDWSTFDTIGGYFPDSTSGNLVFNFGLILKSIYDNSWILIDEINRSDIDKSFGQMFTVLSDNSIETTLPFKISGQHITIKHGDTASSDNNIYISSNWRIIATMNDLDKLSLYDMSYALLRRFAIIDIDIPEESVYINFLNKIGNEVSTQLGNDINVLNKVCSEIRPLGPSIYLDIVRFISESINTFTVPYNTAFKQSFNLFVKPQLTGLLDEKNIDNLINTVLTSMIPDDFVDEHKSDDEENSDVEEKNVDVANAEINSTDNHFEN